MKLLKPLFVLFILIFFNSCSKEEGVKYPGTVGIWTVVDIIDEDGELQLEDLEGNTWGEFLDKKHSNSKIEGKEIKVDSDITDKDNALPNSGDIVTRNDWSWLETDTKVNIRKYTKSTTNDDAFETTSVLSFDKVDDMLRGKINLRNGKEAYLWLKRK